MNYAVVMSSKFERIIREMPRNAQITLKKLVDDIRLSGPAQPGYKNYSKLGSNTSQYIVEVYYVGSREKAPY